MPESTIWLEDIGLFMDGDQWCAVRPDFVDLQESIVGFGHTQEEAMFDLRMREEASHA